ncbi:MAG: hypothetical protein FJ308_10005 [Planctomycetes bacterium]|nr:hypothetical protein [Planctomycetota bacterium]
MLDTNQRRLMQILNRTVGKHPSQWLSRRDLYEERNNFLIDCPDSLTHQAFSMRLTCVLRGLLKRAHEIIDCLPVLYDGINVIEANLEMKKWPTDVSGQTLRYGLLKEYHDDDLPYPIGQSVYDMFIEYRNVIEYLNLPTCHDILAIEEKLEAKFGIKSPTTGVKVDPMTIRDRASGRRLRDLVVLKFEGRPTTRCAETANRFMKVIKSCYLKGNLLSVFYQPKRTSRPAWHLVDIVAVVASYKNGAVYLHGALPEKGSKSKPWRNQEGVPNSMHLKFDRIIDMKETRNASFLSQAEFGAMYSDVVRNDGLFQVSKEAIIPEVFVKVTPDYGRYLDESMPFLQAEHVTGAKLAELKQPDQAICLRILGTNIQHLTNEVFRSRGQMVVLMPDSVVGLVAKELVAAASCQAQFEPLGIATVEGFVQIEGAMKMRAESLPPIGVSIAQDC